MNVLGIEGSGSALALAALDDASGETPRAQFCSQETRQLSRLLIESLDETLTRANWKIGDVDALCVGRGPGSWTSLRIVLSMVKTLAQTREIPLAGLATFEAAARAALASTRTDFRGGAILTLAPSRAGEHYARLFSARDAASKSVDARASVEALETLFSEIVGSPEEIAARVLASTRKRDSLLLCSVGEMPRASLDFLMETWSRDFSQVRETAIAPLELARQIAVLGAAKIARGESDNPLALLPIYVAPSAAERVRAAKLALADGA